MSISASLAQTHPCGVRLYGVMLVKRTSPLRTPKLSHIKQKKKYHRLKQQLNQAPTKTSTNFASRSKVGRMLLHKVTTASALMLALYDVI